MTITWDDNYYFGITVIIISTLKILQKQVVEIADLAGRRDVTVAITDFCHLNAIEATMYSFKA